jgi:vacuolar-type H+-ATPase subunit H
MSIKKVEMDASVENTSTDLSNLTVSIPNFNLNVGSSPLEGYFYLKNPTTDPAINTKIKGKLNLRDLKNAVPMEDVQELSGMLDADVLVNATLSQLEKQQYEDAKMQGHFKLNSFKYIAKGTPPVEISALDASLSPQKLDLRRFDMKYGKSDFRANGAIDNVLAYFSTNKTMTGAMNLRSTNIDANELMGTSSTTTTETKPSDAPATTEKAFDRWDFKVDALVDNLKYETYTLRNLGLRGHFTPNKWLIDEYALKTGASDLNGSGQLLNVWAYMFDQQTVSGNLKVNSNYFDLNPFMTPLTPTAPVKPSAPPAPPAVFLVPKNVNVQVDADMKQVKYTTYNIQNLNGSFSVHDQAAAIKDVTADIFGAQVAMKGAYETSNPAKPLFDLDFALKNMGFKEAFAAFSTAKSFAPIMQYIDGKFNTALTMSGTMGKDMTPDLTTLNAAGGLQTLNAVVNNVKPLTEIGNKLNIDALKRMELKDFKTWFEIKDGKVTVKPFNMQVKDIAMQVGGTHGLNQDMNYQITTKVPRKTLEQNAVGAAASGGLNFITQQAKQAGINIQQGEFINVRFDLTGNLTNPKVNMKVLGSDGQSTLTDQAENTAQAAIDDAKDKAQAELDKAKGQAQKEIDRATDSLQREAQRKMDQLKKEAEQKVKDEVGKVIGKEAGDDLSKKASDEISKKAEDAMGDKGKKAVDDAKKKLDEWDPFKKKKN